MTNPSDFTWDELSEVLHIIKAERTVIVGALHQLKRIDARLQQAEERLLLVIHHNNGDTKGEK